MLIVNRRLITTQVEEARDSPKQARSNEISQSGMFRHEAEGLLSLFLAYLWDDFELVLHHLPPNNLRCRLPYKSTTPTFDPARKAQQ
jgi:hypothetical protein